MAKYKCLADGYVSFKKGQIYDEKFPIPNKTVFENVKELVNFYPDNWELVEEDKPKTNMKSITELLKRIEDVENESIPSIEIFKDGSGGIMLGKNQDNSYVCEWHNREEMNEKLNKLDKQYSQTETNNEWQL